MEILSKYWFLVNFLVTKHSFEKKMSSRKIFYLRKICFSKYLMCMKNNKKTTFVKRLSFFVEKIEPKVQYFVRQAYTSLIFIITNKKMYIQIWPLNINIKLLFILNADCLIILSHLFQNVIFFFRLLQQRCNFNSYSPTCKKI